MTRKSFKFRNRNVVLYIVDDCIYSGRGCAMAALAAWIRGSK